MNVWSLNLKLFNQTGHGCHRRCRGLHAAHWWLGLVGIQGLLKPTTRWQLFPCHADTSWVHLLLNAATFRELSSSKDWKEGDLPCGVEVFVHCEAGRFLRVDGAGIQGARFSENLTSLQNKLRLFRMMGPIMCWLKALHSRRHNVIIWNTHRMQCHTSLLYRMWYAFKQGGHQTNRRACWTDDRFNSASTTTWWVFLSYCRLHPIKCAIHP